MVCLMLYEGQIQQQPSPSGANDESKQDCTWLDVYANLAIFWSVEQGELWLAANFMMLWCRMSDRLLDSEVWPDKRANLKSLDFSSQETSPPQHVNVSCSGSFVLLLE